MKEKKEEKPKPKEERKEKPKPEPKPERFEWPRWPRHVDEKGRISGSL